MTQQIPGKCLVLAALCFGVGCSSNSSPIESETSNTSSPSPTPSPVVKIMPLGDSITQADSEHDSYRRPLWLEMRSAGLDVDFVGSQTTHHRGPAPNQDFDRDHEGHWGWRADEILADITEWVQREQPDMVLVHLGTNDVLGSQSTASTIGELEQIIDRIRAVNPNVRILLAQLIPVDNNARTRDIRNLNTQIAELAAAKSTESSPVLGVDQYTGFDAELDTYDGLHPNLTGEEKMAQRWFSAIEEILSTN